MQTAFPSAAALSMAENIRRRLASARNNWLLIPLLVSPLF
jgi:hypothetical protein